MDTTLINARKNITELAKTARLNETLCANFKDGFRCNKAKKRLKMTFACWFVVSFVSIFFQALQLLERNAGQCVVIRCLIGHFHAPSALGIIPNSCGYRSLDCWPSMNVQGDLLTETDFGGLVDFRAIHSLLCPYPKHGLNTKEKKSDGMTKTTRQHTPQIRQASATLYSRLRSPCRFHPHTRQTLL